MPQQWLLLFALQLCLLIRNGNSQILRRRCQIRSNCFLGIIGFTLHNGTGETCRETCAILPMLKRGWSCGACGSTPSVPTPIGPISPESPTIPTNATPVQRTPVTPVETPVTPFQTPVSPVQAPITPIDNLPVGPYITAGYSERITLPQLPKPNAQPSLRTNCPHLAANVKDWHAASTWSNGAVPKAGEAVSLPANTNVIIRKSVVEILGIISIPATSSLIFDEVAVGIELKTSGMHVLGSLIAGSETCLIETSIAITLYGRRPDDPVLNQPAATYKGISVTGKISLHGKRFFKSWTRLSKTLVPGDKIVLLQDPVNWEPGQKIVIVTTAMKDSREWHRNEVHSIALVNSPDPVAGVGAALSLSTPIQYQHLANNGYQAEVGLLTRTIVIQGSAADSEPSDTDPLTCTVPVGEDRYGDKAIPCMSNSITGFGGHVMVHQGGKGYVQGVEFYRMGQTNVLGRYPMHFHLLGSCPDCYVRASSFHHSFYRCISIHGTNEVSITENVAYDVTGYCFYLEDGVEERNNISFNLAAHIHSIGPKPPNGKGGQNIPIYRQNPNLTLPADVTASGFYITNVHNNLIGNAASGVRIFARIFLMDLIILVPHWLFPLSF